MNEPVVESLFLTGELLADESVSRRILVLGGDGVGLEIARRLTHAGYEVRVLGPASIVSADDTCTVTPDAIVDQVRGFSGGFEVSFRNSSGLPRERYGFVISAMPAKLVPKFKDYGLSPSQSIVSLTELEEKLGSGTWPISCKADRLHAAFLCGLEGGSDPLMLQRVLCAIENLPESCRVQCYVFTRNVKVAAPGLEKRYRECREKGTIFFKFDGEGPTFNMTAGSAVMLFDDPLLGSELELRPDILVVDEHVLPPEALGPLLAAIPSSPAFRPFLQPESTRFCGVETPKAGILAVGPSRGIFSAEQIETDIDAAVVAVTRSVPARDDLPGPPVVDPDKCTMCLTCVRLCPHSAMGFHRHAEADPGSCVRCGICAVECPMAAIRLEPRAGTPDIPGAVARSLARAASSKPIVAFLCSRSADQAMKAAWTAVPDNLDPIVVPCAGSIGVEHMLNAFQQGAAGVLAAGCFKGNCASIYGTSLAQERTKQAGLMLKEIGIDPARVLFAAVAANRPWALRTAFENLLEAARF